MANIDWIKIKNEYINTKTSFRKLSDKYGVSTTAIAGRAKKEKWVEHRKQNLNKTCTKVIQKSAEKIVKGEVDRIGKILNSADAIREKIDESITQLNLYSDMFGGVHESGVIDVSRLKKLTSALKDLKDIAGGMGGGESPEKQAELIEVIQKAVKDEN